MENLFHKLIKYDFKNKQLNLKLYYIDTIINLQNNHEFSQLFKNSQISHFETKLCNLYCYNDLEVPHFKFKQLIKNNPEIIKYFKIEQKNIQFLIKDYEPPYQNYDNSSLLYLIDSVDSIIIGYVYSNIQEHQFIDNFTKYVNIILVEIHPNYRGLKLSILMLKNFIKKINFKYFGLINVGGIPAARCYFTTFTELGFTIYDCYNNIIDKSICLNENTANISMYFIKH